MEYFLAVLYGLVFGVVNVIPGVSGGTMLVVFGCFDKVCGALSLNISEIKRNIKFLIFFGIGGVLGIVGFSFVITFLFDNYPLPTNTFFMGLIVGSIPLIIRNATVKEKLKPSCLIPFLIAGAVVVGMTLLDGNVGAAYSLTSQTDGSVTSYTLENNSDKTVSSWSVQLENGAVIEAGTTVEGASAEVHKGITDKLKLLVGIAKEGDYVLPDMISGGTLAPHESVTFTISGQSALLVSDMSVTVSYAMNVLFFLLLVGVSALAAVAMIIPGVSGSFVMVLLGTYGTVIAAIRNLDIVILIPVAIGVLAGLIFGARLITLLLKRFSLVVYSAILGLVVGSIYAILPSGVGLNLMTLVGVGTFAVGFAVSFFVGRGTKVEVKE